MVKNSLFILFSFKSPNVGVSLNFNALRLVLTAERLSASGSPSRPHGADVFQTQRRKQPISSKIEISSVIVCHNYRIISRWCIMIYRSPMEKKLPLLVPWSTCMGWVHMVFPILQQSTVTKMSPWNAPFARKILKSQLWYQQCLLNLPITVEFGSFWPCLNLSMRLCKARTRFDLAKGWK